MRWEKVQLRTQQAQEHAFTGVSSSGPGKRWGHTCNAIKSGRFLYVFGGYGKDNCQTNQVHVFDTVNQTWSQPMIQGMPPTPRDSHSCTTVGDNLYVFGGTDGMNPLRDLHILDTSSHTWISPSVRGEGPEAREGHSAALVGKRLFIFGGCGKSSDTNDEVYYNDLYILNTETFVWKHATTSGNPPSARDSHTCSSWKNKIIVVGGEDGHDYYLSDVHILDSETLTWKELKTSGQMLSPRAGHATVAFGKNLFVYGGFTDSQNLYDDLYMLDVDTGVWTKVMTTGEGPSSRFSVASDCLDPLKGGVLVFIGGCNRSLEALDDMYYLYTGLANERKLEKLSLRKQLKLKCQEQNLNPVNDRALVRIEAFTDVQQPVPLSSYGQPRGESYPIYEAVAIHGKKTFQAKVTENLPHGYTIETIVDGKPLRGILFSNKPIPALTTNHNPSSRKRGYGEEAAMLNGDCNGNLKASKVVKQDAMDHRQADGVHGKESMSTETAFAAAAPDVKNPPPFDASQPFKEPLCSKPSVSLLNLNNDTANDIPNCTTEVPKETTYSLEKESAALSPKQEDPMPTSEGHNDPAKSI
ncbi:kelch domain-containing protein 3-like isoform X3 [Mangifera indica]|uniref:kelch domain-containing protein 3-like isoform X3 n=1 Tax=Mangifera indica TaxID=29780 RepID=UPI001CFAE362|nr:kelch domain-containing protein 3-like isoform X3 [Mangifera indica]